MKLKKASLLKLTANKLAQMGYCACKDSTIGTDGLFIKSLPDKMFLCLGLVISRFYESSFTGSFYLSRTTRWSSVWGDIPQESYRRIGHFLLPEERKKLLDLEQAKEGIVDAWWNTKSPIGLESFFEAVSIAEPRFVNQPDLLKKINESLEVKEMSEQASLVIEMVMTERVIENSFRYIPEKEVDGIPMTWFKASEIVLNERNGILNRNTVKLLAADAWRQYLPFRK